MGCPIGSYKTEYSNDNETSCAPCDVNKTTEATGSKNESACGQFICGYFGIEFVFAFAFEVAFELADSDDG